MRAVSFALAYFIFLIIFTTPSVAKLASDYEQKTILVVRVEDTTVYSSEGNTFTCTDNKLQNKLKNHVRIRYITLGNKKIIVDVKNAPADAFPEKGRPIHTPLATK